MRRITAQSYNNKLQVISTFLQYLQVTDYIGEFSNPIPLYYKKSYPGVNEIDNLDVIPHFIYIQIMLYSVELKAA